MQLLDSQGINWRTGVDYLWIIVMFLSAAWNLILTAPIHCRAPIAETLMQCYISPNLMKKQTHLHLEWFEGWAHFHFWVNYYLNDVLNSAQIYQDLNICIQMSEISKWTLQYLLFWEKHRGQYYLNEASQEM